MQFGLTLIKFAGFVFTMHVDSSREATEKRLNVARAGHEMVSTRYSKEAQWNRFEAHVASI
jgi:hypothetical protein